MILGLEVLKVLMERFNIFFGTRLKGDQKNIPT